MRDRRVKFGFSHTNESELLSFFNFYFAFPNKLSALIDTYDDLESGLLNTLLVATFGEELGMT